MICCSDNYHRHPARKMAHAHEHEQGHHVVLPPLAPEVPTDDAHLMFLMRRSIAEYESNKVPQGFRKGWKASPADRARHAKQRARGLVR